jgi:hypothetical protein
MQIDLQCKCGEVHTVHHLSAGRELACRCGRSLQIPLLSQMRSMSGSEELQLSPALEIEQLLLAGALSKTTHCVDCGLETDHGVEIVVECERAQTEHARSWPTMIFNLLTFPVFVIGGLLIFRFPGSRQPPTEKGTDRIYTLPVKICGSCAAQIRGPKEAKRVLGLVPVYARLLKKYPEAKVFKRTR